MVKSKLFSRCEMKNKIALIIVISLMAAFSIEASPSRFDISVNMFYSSLHPYGTWLEIDNGLIVWRPSNVNRRWKPYTNGRWSWTQHGWYWDSYEAYGWAVYHYGRWFYDDYYGWIWIPDNVWGPSWVEWRYDDNYIGWAPLPPYASFHSSFGIRFTTGWRSHHSYWNFVSYRRFCDPRINYYIVDSKRGSRIFENTKYRTNYYSDRDRIINGGIDRSFIERKGGYRINERNIASVDNHRDFERNRDVRNDRVIAYRPSDREVESGRTIEKLDIKRGENRSTLKREKIRTPLARDDDRTISSDRSGQTDREINVERDTKRDEGLIREESKREQSTDQFRRDAERDRIRVESENQRKQKTERNRIEKKNDESNVNKETNRGRQPIYERPNRTEMPTPTERKVEPRRESTYERPTPKTDRGSDRSPSKSERKSEDRSSDRKK